MPKPQRPLPGMAEITILGIDGSTDDTGWSIIRFNRFQSIGVIATGHYIAKATHKNSKTARLLRIAETAKHLRAFLGSGGTIQTGFGGEWTLDPFEFFEEKIITIDVVAYEWHTERNPDVSEALSQAAGVYLYAALDYLPSATICRVSPQAARMVYSRKNLNRQEKKPAAIQWARRELGLTLADSDDATADACAVCFGAWGQWRESLLLAAEKPMMGKGSRGSRIK